MINLVFFLTELSVLGVVLRYLWICDAPAAGRTAVPIPVAGRRAAGGYDFGSFSASDSGFDSNLLYRTAGPVTQTGRRADRLSGAGTFGSRPADGWDNRGIWPEAVRSSGTLNGFFDIPDTNVLKPAPGPQILDAAAFECPAEPAVGVREPEHRGELRPAACSDAASDAAGSVSDCRPGLQPDDDRCFFTAA